MSKLQAELMEALSIKEKKGEARQALLKRIFAAANAMDDKPFGDLTSKAQTWANNAAKANDADPPKPIPEFPDYKPEAAAEAASEVKAPKGEAPKGKPAKEAKPAKAEKAPKEPKAEKAPKEKKGPGKIHKMKTLMLKNLGVSVEDLKAKLVAAGVEVSDSTITTVRSDFLSSIRVLQDAGKLAENLLD